MFGNQTNITISNYPLITDELIDRLEIDFPNKLPTDYINDYELGILIGQQKVIDKLKFEKEYNEKEAINDDEDD